VTPEALLTLLDELIAQLIAEEEISHMDTTETESLIKHLNSNILRILENANPDHIFTILFDLLIKHRRLYSYSKTLGVIIKCLLKLTKGLEAFASQIKPENILLKAHEYMVEFGGDVENFSDDMGIKAIKTMLHELVRLFKEKLWDHYSQTVQTHPEKDEFLQK